MRMVPTRPPASPLPAALAVGILCTSAWGQAPAPDPHWGSNLYPQSKSELRAGLSFNRFTQFNGGASAAFNEIEETAGINFLNLAYATRIPAYPEWSVSLSTGVGITADQPTEWFQNDFVHEIVGLDEVPVGGSRGETEFTGGLALTRWFEPEPNQEWFVGGGVVTGTLYHESYFYGGGSTFFEDARVQLQYLARVSAPVGGGAYPDVSSYTAIAQTSVAYVPDRIQTDNPIMGFLGNPELGATVTFDTGLFEDSGGDPIGTMFTSLYAKWATGLYVETWNDAVNGTDFGPTFGFTVSADLSTLLRLNS